MISLFLLVTSVSAAIYDAASHPKFISELPIPPAITAKDGDSILITVVQTVHDFGLLDKDTNQSVITPTLGYNGIHPGPTFHTQRPSNFTVTWLNQLPDEHLMRDYIDPTIHCGNVVNKSNGQEFMGNCLNPETRIVPHLHGAETGPVADGYAESWWDNKNGYGYVGPYYQTNTYRYSLDQQAGHLWYHDHALGITRLNIYSGMIGHWFVHDDAEESLSLPSGQYEIPLVIQDRTFTSDGALEYPVDHFSGVASVPDGTPSILPEFFGSYISVNGKLWPKINVEARKYRFRLLNGCDSRFLLIFTSIHVDAWIIGTDQGLLHTPVQHDMLKKGLLFSPSERYDLVIDFHGNAGKRIILSNTANIPFPGGDPVDPNADGLILAFEVSATEVKPDPPIPETLVPPYVVPPTIDYIRSVTLNEIEDEYGRTNPLLGVWEDGQSIIKYWSDAITEIVKYGTTEIWKIINLTDDAHPVHLHLVGFHVLGRQLWNTTTLSPEGDLYSAADIGIFYKEVERQAKKDVVIVYPGTVLSILVHFRVDGLTMWHCHISAHEDHEMMRPILIVADGYSSTEELDSFLWNATKIRD